jgi:ABC-type antimicrobial peptide transport system permease subunit
MHRGAVAGLAPVAIGVVVGLPAAALVARTVVAVLPGLSFLDATIYAVVSLLIVGGTAVAALAAAWRLRSVDPVDALRAE